MFKKILIAFSIIIIVAFAAFAVVKSRGDATYFDDYNASLPVDAKVTEKSEVNETKELFGVTRERQFTKTLFDFEARPGDRVPCVMAQPLGYDGSTKLPTIIFVHGSGQRKGFVEEICTPFVKAGFAMVSYDQWNCGERKLKGNGLEKITAWYTRGWKAVNDARRLADYLVTRPDVDPDRLFLVGASYGAMTSTHILALDKRFKAGVFVVGGGDFKIMLDAPLIKREVPGLLLAVVKPAARWLGAAFDPMRSAAQTGPMPILMQCGSADTLVTPDAGRALYAGLAAPKEIRWYDVDHPGLRDGDGPEVVRMLDEGLEWLAPKAGLPVPAIGAAAAASEPQHASAQ
jgi:dienelactone hydrolase